MTLKILKVRLSGICQATDISISSKNLFSNFLWYKMNIRDIYIPVPWGHIAVKIWGDIADSNPKVFAFHGILDNAATFDLLIPQLPTDFTYICADFPGHGRSSPFPPDIVFHLIDFVPIISRISNYFNQEKFILMGHSLGAQVCCCYAHIYPEKVQKLVLLDGIIFYPVPPKDYPQYLRTKLDNYFQSNEQEPKRYVSVEQAVTDMVNVRKYYPIEASAAECLVKRSIVPVSEGQYILNIDPRIRGVIRPLYDIKYILQVFRENNAFQCPVLLMVAEYNTYHQKHFKELIDLLKRKRNFKIIHVKGHHNVHSNNPELVAPFVNTFLTSIKSKL